MKKIKVSPFRPNPIPPFKTLDEEADFWDTHDTSALFDNPETPLSELPLIEPEKEEVLSLRVQRSVKNRLKKIAWKKGVNPTTLARMWIIERLNATGA